MIVKSDGFWLISRNSNDDYWGKTKSPDWTAVGSIKHYPSEGMGMGVEPHYHDADEVWIFAYGRGEAWIDGQVFEVTDNTAVYTPMGAIHRYQMFTDYDTVSVVTKLERRKRDTHLYPEEHGAPVPTVPGFVVPGGGEQGSDRRPRRALPVHRSPPHRPGARRRDRGRGPGRQRALGGNPRHGPRRGRTGRERLPDRRETSRCCAGARAGGSPQTAARGSA